MKSNDITSQVLVIVIFTLVIFLTCGTEQISGRELQVLPQNAIDANLDELSSFDYVHNLHRGNRRVKKVLSTDDLNDEDGFFDDMEDKKAGGNPQKSLRSKRFSNVPTSTRLVLFPFLAFSEGLHQVFNPTSNARQKEELALGPNNNNQNNNFIRKDDSSINSLVKTRANITAVTLRGFHSTLFHGISKFCPVILEKYENMFKIVNDSINMKIDEIQQQLAPEQIQSMKLQDLKGNIVECYKNFIAVPGSIPEPSETAHRHNTNPLLIQIHKYLDEEGAMFRKASQLDITPNTANLVRFERLCLQAISIFCSISDDKKDEHHRTGSFLLSVIDFNKFNPKPTIHQRDMEEMIDETRDCLKLRIKTNAGKEVGNPIL